MKLSHATLLLEGKSRMPKKGDICDMSCEFAFACANMKDGELCQGFQLLSNGKITTLIKQNLMEHDHEYIGNCIRMVQDGCTPETEELMVQEVYRYIEYLKQPEGFRAMLESAFERTIKEPEPISELSDFQIILGKALRPNEPDFHAKATAHQQEPHISFFKYHQPPEYPQKTNLEIQEEMKDRGEKKNE